MLRLPELTLIHPGPEEAEIESQTQRDEFEALASERNIIDTLGVQSLPIIGDVEQKGTA